MSLFIIFASCHCWEYHGILGYVSLSGKYMNMENSVFSIIVGDILEDHATIYSCFAIVRAVDNLFIFVSF